MPLPCLWAITETLCKLGERFFARCILLSDWGRDPSKACSSSSLACLLLVLAMRLPSSERDEVLLDPA